MSSNIRVFVQFKDESVFAGDDVECIVTFKNVEPVALRTPRQTSAQGPNGLSRSPSVQESSRASQPSSSRKPSVASQSATSNQSPKSNDPSSFSVVDRGEDKRPDQHAGFHIAETPQRRSHARSVSIISLGSDTGSGKPRKSPIVVSQRPKHAHGRSASLQITPTYRKTSRSSPAIASKQFIQPSPLAATSNMTYSAVDLPTAADSARRISEANVITPVPSSAAQARRPGAATAHSYAFSPFQNQEQFGGDASSPSTRKASPRPEDEPASAQPEQMAPLSRVFSVQSAEDTPRPSTEIYPNSNHSEETLVSEYATQALNQPLNSTQHSRSPSKIRPTRRVVTETLMMGYVQISGYFMLDGSLVNQAPFEEIKRKAVVGGQGGGGVVGITKPSEQNGIFGALSWNSIGESLGGILGGSELSSIKEMKGIANSKAIPLISTAKSVLFVDLKLDPGESKSYSYAFKLPRGLPPSHRGRAMKVVYSLVIGTQRPGSGKGQQQVKQVEVPFRVFSGVNSKGEMLGHDLMQPHIILKDQARTYALDSDSESPSPRTKEQHAPSQEEAEKPSQSTAAADFREYITDLLNKPRTNSRDALLSPTADGYPPETPLTPFATSGQSFRSNSPPLPLPSTRSLIDIAIRLNSRPKPLRDSQAQAPSATVFSIARSHIPIATLTLSRPALKLGDLLTFTLDFSNAHLPTYALEASLESAERVSPTLAIRSAPSIERATRRVWARKLENCIWCRRCVCSFQVPTLATPGFNTSGVALEWCVRVEIVVGQDVGAGAVRRRSSSSSGDDDEEEDGHGKDGGDAAPQPGTGTGTPLRGAATPLSRAVHLLEEVNRDERGTVLEAAQRLPCESFEVTIPIKVFGAAVGPDQSEGPALEGFAI